MRALLVVSCLLGQAGCGATPSTRPAHSPSPAASSTPPSAGVPVPAPSEPVTEAPRPAEPVLPEGASDGTSICDRLVIAVTPDHYVWVDGDREESVTIPEAVVRLGACRETLQLPLICPPPSFAPCRYRTAVVWYTGGEAELIGRGVRARLDALTQAVQAAGITMLGPQVMLDDTISTVYRSRRELGPSASLVPRNFDWSTHWLVRAFRPSAESERHCRDEELGLSPAVANANHRHREARARFLAHGRAAALIGPLPVRRHEGRISVVLPRQPPPPGEVDGPCQLSWVPEAVLVPIAHTLLPVGL